MANSCSDISCSSSKRALKAFFTLQRSGGCIGRAMALTSPQANKMSKMFR